MIELIKDSLLEGARGALKLYAMLFLAPFMAVYAFIIHAELRVVPVENEREKASHGHSQAPETI